MTENAKTGMFVGTAALVGVLAWLSIPKQVSNQDAVEAIVGKPIFEKFVDPADVSNLKIVKFDETIGSIKKFELSRDTKSGAWVIPSHDSYPADAASQVSKVANAFVGLRALTVAARLAGDHKDFGVVEPDETKEQVGETGIGTFVSMENAKGETLVNLVIGKEVRDDPKKRYVRRTGNDPVYTADIDPTILSTDFATWIEGDLLKLSSTDIASLSIRDYNIIAGPSGRNALKKNFDAEIDYLAKDGKWESKSIKVYEKKDPTERRLGVTEELNTTKLNEIRNTLDNLKIVDVVRKPKGLAADLKADKELLDDNDKILSLAKRGFMPGEGPDGKLEIFSKNGELAVRLNDGVEYLLRFGETVGSLGGGEDGETKDAAALNRTLFVTARLDESFYPMPELQKVPETVEEMKEIEAKEAAMKAAEEAAAKSAEPAAGPDLPPFPPADSAPAETSQVSDEAKIPEALKAPESKLESAIKETTPPPAAPKLELPEPTETPAADLPKGSDVPSEPPAGDKSSLHRKSTVRLVSVQNEGKEDTKEVAPSEKSDTASTSEPDAKKAEETDKPAEASKSTPGAKESEAKAETADELKERLEAMRERITKENTRLLDDRKNRMEAAKKKAAELNARFADWYYEISDNEYKRLRVSLEDLIKPKGPPAGTPGN